MSCTSCKLRTLFQRATACLLITILFMSVTETSARETACVEIKIRLQSDTDAKVDF